MAVNSDASARRLGKGDDRPHNAHDDRMAVIAGLAAVDLVVPFDADTPRDLILACRPDVLVKGGDYTADTTAGAAETIARGGRFVAIPLAARPLDDEPRRPHPRPGRRALSVALLVLPDFLLIAFGALLARRARFDAGFWSGVERLVYFVLFPALLFRALASAPLAFTDALPFVATGVAFTLGGIALSALGQPLCRLPRDVFAACFQCGFRFNTYIAIAIAGRVAGEAGLARLALLIGVLVPLVNVAAVAVLARGRATHIGRELARNPLVLACAAGLAWNALALPRPAVAMRVVELLAAAALPLGLLAVGAGLRVRGTDLPPRAIAWWNGVKLVALPALALAFARLFGLNAMETTIVVAMAAVPTATSAYVLAVQMGAPGAPVALLISTGTISAAVTLPLWLALVA